VPPPEGEVKELQRAAVLFPRLFLWVISIGMMALLGLGSVVVAQQRGVVEETKQKVETHERVLAERGTKIQLLEQAVRDLKDTSTETRQDVKEIRRLIEERMPRRVER